MSRLFYILKKKKQKKKPDFCIWCNSHNAKSHGLHWCQEDQSWLPIRKFSGKYASLQKSLLLCGETPFSIHLEPSSHKYFWRPHGQRRTWERTQWLGLFSSRIPESSSPGTCPRSWDWISQLQTRLVRDPIPRLHPSLTAPSSFLESRRVPLLSSWS